MPFTEQIDGINDQNYPMPIRVGFAALVKMQVTYSIFLHNKGANSPGSDAHICNNPNPAWQIAMVNRQQAQTAGFAAIYASAPLLPDPTPPIVIPYIPQETMHRRPLSSNAVCVLSGAIHIFPFLISAFQKEQQWDVRQQVLPQFQKSRSFGERIILSWQLR
jgi:hypothetical protein